MNGVFFYSNTGESWRIAEYFADKLGLAASEIFDYDGTHYESIVLVFPVYCQNVPDVVGSFLGKVSVDALCLVATYGRMSYGNVLFEIQRKYNKRIIAAAYVPCKHSYIDGDIGFDDFHALDVVIEKFGQTSEITVPRSYKNPLADILPAMRSRMGLKIRKSGNCDGCGICDSVCRRGGISRGKTNGRCIRCLRCVTSCPRNALTVRLCLPMRLYLRKTRKNDTVIYV